jgi:hypothetical protein
MLIPEFLVEFGTIGYNSILDIMLSAISNEIVAKIKLVLAIAGVP